MNAHELNGKRVVIWGAGMEGQAAATFIMENAKPATVDFIDDKSSPEDEKNAILARADIVIKSPGVSLYKPEVQALLARGVSVTSLLNLWLAQPHTAKIIGITGSKGKSTTSSLLLHVLHAAGCKVALCGNIGTPVTAINLQETEIAIVETSSYQAATLSQPCDIGLVTALYPEHLDWHGSVKTYYADKLNLLTHSHTKIATPQVISAAMEHHLTLAPDTLFMTKHDFHAEGTTLFESGQAIGSLDNPYLLRAHNLANVYAVLSIVRALGKDVGAALSAMADFKGLPHRQQELGVKDGLLYVNDSLSTTPQSAIAAMAAYAGRPLTLIAGGFDRGIDYAPLVIYLINRPHIFVVCLGESGARIFGSLRYLGMTGVAMAATMDEAVLIARLHTSTSINGGGVVLLSPAAPSYGLFKDYAERGESFKKASGV
ncbi:MAG TPA: UDP-N-acetylmuramoyl-L-alanine--D-glutamate ligase [Rhodospirillaceae bacterium]|nr:UDP-N-acetylmuramoyl-L-alanine--D-glutamate ligase [Rhodospirillaceae bacterium]